MFRIGQKVRFKESLTLNEVRITGMREPHYQYFVLDRNVYKINGYAGKIYSDLDVELNNSWIIPEAFLESAEVLKCHPLTNIFKDNFKLE